MGACVRIVVGLLLVVAVTAGPAKRSVFDDDINKDVELDHSGYIVPPKKGDQEAAASELEDHSIEVVSGAQTFFPSFANLFEPRQQASFRIPGFGNQEAAYSQRPNSYRSLLNYPLFSNFRNSDSFTKPQPSAAPLVEAPSSVLGSGNFGIIRGGTFFAQNDESDEFEDGFSNFYNNGHGRPASNGYIANPRPNYQQDQFANFRDFADINSPSNSAYSNYVVVYANKNATMDEISEESRRVSDQRTKPKNIIETLESLDTAKPISKAPVRPVKLSKAKAKLEATFKKTPYKKDHWKKYFSVKQHDPEEPLLALS